MTVETGFPGSHDVVGTADRDRPQLPESGLPSEALHQGDTIQAWHPNIREEQIGGPPSQPRQGFATVPRGVDACAEPDHRVTEQISAVLVVIDDEDGDAPKGARLEQVFTPHDAHNAVDNGQETEPNPTSSRDVRWFRTPSIAPPRPPVEPAGLGYSDPVGEDGTPSDWRAVWESSRRASIAVDQQIKW
jgi:hypothetical protein